MKERRSDAMRVTVNESFKMMFPDIQEEDVFYDTDRDILHVGMLKLRTGLQGDVYEVVLDEHGFTAYAVGKYGHGTEVVSKDFFEVASNRLAERIDEAE